MKKQSSRAKTSTRKTLQKRSSRTPAKTKQSVWLSPNVLPLIVIGSIAFITIAAVIISNIVAGSKDKFVLVKGQYHHSTQLGLSATYPLGWTITDKSTSSLLAILYASSTPGDPFAATNQTDDKDFSMITVSKEPVDGNLDKVSQEIFAADKSDAKINKKIIKQSDIEVGGLPAKVQEATSALGHEEYVVAVNNNNIGYMFIVYASDTKWQTLQPAWETLLHTVKFDQQAGQL